MGLDIDIACTMPSPIIGGHASSQSIQLLGLPKKELFARPREETRAG